MELQLINEEDFNKLSAAEKRVAICKDVIARIDAQNIVPYNGQFWKGKYDITQKTKESFSPQQIFNQNKCEVCAKGAIFCSWVGNFNRVGWEQAGCASECIYVKNRKGEMIYPKEILEIFGRKFLDNLEAAFEGEGFPWHYDKMETFHYAEGFDGCNSLRELMHNIVVNGGDLVIPA